MLSKKQWAIIVAAIIGAWVLYYAFSLTIFHFSQIKFIEQELERDGSYVKEISYRDSIQNSDFVDLYLTTTSDFELLSNKEKFVYLKNLHQRWRDSIYTIKVPSMHIAYLHSIIVTVDSERYIYEIGDVLMDSRSTMLYSGRDLKNEGRSQIEVACGDTSRAGSGAYSQCEKVEREKYCGSFMNRGEEYTQQLKDCLSSLYQTR